MASPTTSLHISTSLALGLQQLLKGSGRQRHLILESGVMQYSSDGLSIFGSHFVIQKEREKLDNSFV